MKFSVLMTVYNRPQLTLMNTLVKLGANDFTDGEIVIVNDGSTIPYEPIRDAFKDLPIRWVDAPGHNGAYSLDGYNNPSAAWNLALKEARGDVVFPLSSDCIVPPYSIDAAFELDMSNVVWMCCVVDMDTNQTYFGPDAIRPLGWFYGVCREKMRNVGWDENYMKGLAFEDNDVMARLGLEMGRFVLDMRCTAWHQSHPQTAYSDKLKGWNINRGYTIEKWGAIPWGKDCPLKKTATRVNHQVILDIEKA